MPKKTPIEDQFGAYEDPPDLNVAQPKQKNFGGMPDKGSYEKVATEDKAEAPPAASSAGYPRSIPFTNCGPYLTNYVSTTKYSRFTFLPLATIAQYKRAANVYLLFIAVLCCIPAISPLMPIAAVMPVVFVLTISLIREGAEDYARYKSDEDMNNKTTFVRNPASGQFEEVMWKDVHVGDMIKLADRDWIPTDVLMLTSSAEDGCAYIDTMDLDGETNLKRRTSPKVTTGLKVEDVGQLSGGHLQCAGPSGDLYRFDGALKMSNGKTAAVSEQNMLLRSSRLRNTKWAVGVVIYTGMEAKVMLNSINAGKAKQSALEVIVNKAIMLIFVIQLCMAVLSAILSGAWAASACGSHTYLGCSSSGAGTASLTFWTYIILLNSLIPASLIVTMEIVKVVHASFINWDHTLCKRYDKKEERWRGAEAHTSALNEGLGQIDYIFSDKTGTLTENKMELQYVTIDGTIYGAATGVTYSEKTKPDGKLQIEPVGSGGEEQKEALTENSSAWKFNRMLAVCQTVLIEKEDDGSLSYNADSPDEVALVLGGKTFGAEFTGRENGDVSQVNVYPSGKPGQGPKVQEQWRVLSTIPFSSKRKRMTVIVQRVSPAPDHPGEVQLWMKGADNVIMDRVDKSNGPLISKYNKHLVHFSTLGLRTLCFATKTMAQSDHAKWASQWEDAALLPPDQREAKFEELACLVEDVGFVLCGATAVEDKLQENVPETIVRLARANVKLWVLTGDKQETAIEIGRSTNLLTPSMRMHVLNAESEYDVNQKLDKELADALFGKEQNQKQGLVVDGATLNYVLEGDPQGALICKAAADKFVALATQCVAVVVCRSSPLQKALIVLLVKKYVPGVRTLAVGDGANDVPMIRAAAIGIGIAGLEGMQAARAADYAIQQFQDLDRLMLHHGRLSYFRIANMCCYFFYKSWAFTLPQWLFGFYCGYSGISFYEALYVPSFNMFFTSMPVFARAVLDTDVDITKAHPLLPEMYHVSQDDLLFNQKALGSDLLLSFVHAAFCFWSPLLMFGADDQDLWQTSLGCYSLVVFVCTMRILVHTRALTVPSMFAYGASICVYFAWQYFYDSAGASTIRGAAPTLNSDNGKFKFMVMLVLGLTCATEMAMRFLADNLQPSNVDIIRAAKPEDINAEGKRRNDAASAAQVS